MLKTFKTQSEAVSAAKRMVFNESRTAEDGLSEALVLLESGNSHLYRCSRSTKSITVHLRPGWPADSRGKAVFASRELAERSLL